ncbi:histone-fold-containing protein [Ephemerocybe angulata]|uniref:Histone-fold-containing protein n=1 Tax=Ephemerocybe angulata TaxID=980116 RepID=A0A8H6HZ99_9AGAR|nr:histone-fold-containing protein [Tulosesus angulatus]
MRIDETEGELAAGAINDYDSDISEANDWSDEMKMAIAALGRGMGPLKIPSYRKRQDLDKAYRKRRRRVPMGIRPRTIMEAGTFRPMYRRVLKEFHPEMLLSQQSVIAVDDYMGLVLARLVQIASGLASNHYGGCLDARDIQTAVRLLFPDKLGILAVSSGTKAVTEMIQLDKNMNPNES